MSRRTDKGPDQCEGPGKLMECIPEIQGDSINSWVIRLMHGYGSVNFMKFRQMGLYPGQLPVLIVLHGREGISLREIAGLLHIKPPTVTVTVQRLEKAGFVRKKPDEKDLRISRIYLTEKGKNLSEEMRRLVEEDEQMLTRGFSEEELLALKDFLRRMTENMIEAKNRK